LEVGVQASCRENTLRADHTPYNGGVEEHTTIGTIEFVGLVLGANICDSAAESPFKHCNLYDAGPKGGDCLCHEHGTRGDFHVLAQFEVLGEVETLCHGYVAVGLEEHHGEWAAGLNVASDEFALAC